MWWYILVPRGYGFWHVRFWLALKFYLLWGTKAIQPWRSMDKGALPLGLEELGKPHCGAKQWALDIFTTELCTLQMTKSWLWPGNEAKVWANRTIMACSAGTATCGVECWAFHTQTHYHKRAPVRSHLHTRCARGMMQIHIPNTLHECMLHVVSDIRVQGYHWSSPLNSIQRSLVSMLQDQNCSRECVCVCASLHVWCNGMHERLPHCISLPWTGEENIFELLHELQPVAHHCASAK